MQVRTPVEVLFRLWISTSKDRRVKQLSRARLEEMQIRHIAWRVVFALHQKFEETTQYNNARAKMSCGAKWHDESVVRPVLQCESAYCGARLLCSLSSATLKHSVTWVAAIYMEIASLFLWRMIVYNSALYISELCEGLYMVYVVVPRICMLCRHFAKQHAIYSVFPTLCYCCCHTRTISNAASICECCLLPRSQGSYSYLAHDAVVQLLHNAFLV